MRGLPFVEQPYDLLLLTELPTARPYMRPQPNGEDVFDSSNKAKVGNTFEIKRSFESPQHEWHWNFGPGDQTVCSIVTTRRVRRSGL